MTRRLAVVLAIALATAAGLAAVGALRPLVVLELTNTSRSRVIALPVPGSGFSVTYHHSMYDQPVTEEFVVAPGGGIVLQAVSSPSAAVLEYFGITTIGERHRVVRSMPEVVFRVAAGAPQRLRIGDDERSFSTFGAPGDRILVRAACRPGLACALADRFHRARLDATR